MEGGGVMSDDESRGGDKNFLSDCEERSLTAALRSGEGDRVLRWTGVAGARISAGGARGL